MPYDDARLLADVAGLVAAVVDAPADDVRPEHTFVEDLAVDSLAMLELLERCRVDLGVDVEEQAVSQLVHVGDLMDYLRHRGR